MSKTKFLLVILLFILLGCRNDPFANWPAFPDREFVSYFPYDFEQTLKYYNSDGVDTLAFIVYKNSFHYDKITDSESDCYGCETAKLTFEMSNEEKEFEVSIASAGRRDLSSYCRYGSVYHSIIYTYDASVSDIHDFNTLLTDTLFLKSQQTEDYVIIVKNEGIVEFSDSNTVWKLSVQ